MLTMKTLREQIRRDLLLVTDYVKRSVKQDMTDINRYAEDFYCGLLNTAFGWELRNLNREKKNHPAIDLADDENRIGVQVTSTETRGKITHTLKKFFEDGLDAKYERLIVLVMGTEEAFRDPFKVERNFDFDPDRDIWDTPRLTDKLENIENIDTLKQVAEYLQKHLDIPRQVVRPLNLPVPEFRSPVGFLGRRRELDEIRRELKRTKPVILAGLGGVGKTMLASHFAKDWPGTALFVRFDGSFTRTLADGVGRHIPPEQRKGLDEAAVAELALELLRQYGEEDLLIVDNAEVDGTTWRELTRDPCYAKLRLLPMKLLMTTRLRDTGGIWVGNLEQEELRQIFRGHDANVPEPMMDELIRAVGGHTMTVDMIARTIRESWGDVTPEDILMAMKSCTLKDGDFDEIENDHDPEQRQIYAHLKALFNLSGISEDGKQALRCATLLPQDGMNARLFRDALPDGPRDEIKKLEKRGWVDLENGLLKIHPVVRLVCRTELEPTDGSCERFLNNCWTQYRENTSVQADIWSLAELFKQAVYTLEDRDHIWVNRALMIYWKLGELQLEKGNYKIALESGRRFLELQRHAFPYDYARIADAYRYVGRTMVYLENYEEALAYQLEAISFWLKLRLPDNPELAKTYSNVGQTYFELGKYKESLTYMQKALNISVKILPEKHPDFATLYENMGIIYNKLGMYEIALEYEMRLLEMGEEVLGRDNIDTARIYCQLAQTLLSMGECEQASEQMRRTAEIVDKLNLPEWHPIRGVYNNLMNDIEEKKEEIKFIGRRRANNKRIKGWLSGLLGHKS